MGFRENREESSEFFTVDLPPLRPFLTHEWNPAAQEFSAFDRIFRVEFSISREKKRDEDIVGRISFAHRCSATLANFESANARAARRRNTGSSCKRVENGPIYVNYGT